MGGSAFSYGGLILQVAALLLLAATLANTLLRLRIGIAVAGAAGMIAFAIGGEPVGALWAGLLALVSVGQILLVRSRENRVRFSEEERVLAESGLPRFSRTQARHFIDQGMWINGKPGEVLTREGEPVSHLFFLAVGSARVINGAVEIATFAAPGFLGEITVLSRDGATGTVVLAEDSRFWCISADALRRLIAGDAELGTLLENSFAGAVSDKLRLSNRMRAEQGVGPAA